MDVPGPGSHLPHRAGAGGKRTDRMGLFDSLCPDCLAGFHAGGGFHPLQSGSKHVSGRSQGHVLCLRHTQRHRLLGLFSDL